MSKDKKKTIEKKAGEAGEAVGKELKKDAKKTVEVAKAFGKGVKGEIEKEEKKVEKK